MLKPSQLEKSLLLNLRPPLSLLLFHFLLISAGLSSSLNPNQLLLRLASTLFIGSFVWLLFSLKSGFLVRSLKVTIIKIDRQKTPRFLRV